MSRDAPGFRPRFRIRTLLVLVLVSALGLGFETMRRRAVKYRSQIRSHAASELYCRNAAAALEHAAVYTNTKYGEYLKAIRRLQSPGDDSNPRIINEDTIKSIFENKQIDEDVKKSVFEYGEEAAGWRKRAADHAAMRLRYERAIWRPWLSAP